MKIFSFRSQHCCNAISRAGNSGLRTVNRSWFSFPDDFPFSPEFRRELGFAGHIGGDGGSFVAPIDALRGLAVVATQHSEIRAVGLAWLQLPMQCAERNADLVVAGLVRRECHLLAHVFDSIQSDGAPGA